ncbi:ECI3 [Symbiodinium pilosum]|uniref:ECI3 protein n=1 Tax=Symbiodinium pilosum TaxID=2952 RepID=A0A812R8Y2_SYMPI|nr:ECI3 [Symbiodinium pilosum]
MARVFGDEVSLIIRDGVAVMTLLAQPGTWSWGTAREEHRFNPVTVRAWADALDVVEADEAVNVLIVTNDGKYWSNGMDLRYLDKHADGAASLQQETNKLMARVCCFPRPTVAAFRGHWCAAGGMMGLAFDFRLMSRDAGFFFIPGVDLGLVYAPLQAELMKAKLPRSLHRDVILFNSRRWTAVELLAAGVVDEAVPRHDVLLRAQALAALLRPKGAGPARAALGGDPLFERSPLSLIS